MPERNAIVYWSPVRHALGELRASVVLPHGVSRWERLRCSRVPSVRGPAIALSMSIRGALSVLVACALCACVEPRVQRAGNHDQPPALEDGRAVMTDGTALPLHRWLPATGAPSAVVLALHGLNDYGAAFDRLGEHLSNDGMAVYAFDQRGYGGTEQRGIWPGAEVLADDVWRVAELLRSRHPDVPLYALGESMGGAVLLYALRRHGTEWVDAVALMAPGVWRREHMRWYQRWPLEVLAHTWRGVKLSGRAVGRSPSDDPATLEYLDEDPLVLRSARADVLWGIANLMDTVTSDTELMIPTLILYGAEDEIVPERPMCRWVQTLDPAEPWQFAVYPKGWHLLARGLDAPAVLTDLAAWLASPGVPLPSGADARGLPFCADYRESG